MCNDVRLLSIICISGCCRNIIERFILMKVVVIRSPRVLRYFLSKIFDVKIEKKKKKEKT